MNIKNKTSRNLAFDEMIKVQKIYENRPSGAESEEERKKYGYSKQEIDAEKKYLNLLKKVIINDIKNGTFSNLKNFILGLVGGVLYLMDGQHVFEVYSELIKEGLLNKDIEFYCNIYEYDSFDDMLDDLAKLNEGRKWRKGDTSRLRDINSDGRELYENISTEFYGKLDDGIIKQCIFGQHNGENIYSSNISPYYRELIELTLLLEKKCKDLGLQSNDVKRLIGVNHAASCFRDLERIIFRELVNINKGVVDNQTIDSGMEICGRLIDGIFGEFSSSKSNWNAYAASNLFKVNVNREFKKQFLDKWKNGDIKISKRKNQKE